MYIVISSTVAAINSVVVGSLSAKFGKNIFLLIAFVVDAGQYIFLLLWVPTIDNSWIVYLIAVAYGLVNSILLVTVQGKSIL